MRGAIADARNYGFGRIYTSKAVTGLSCILRGVKPGYSSSESQVDLIFVFSVGKISQKNSLKECVFINLALFESTRHFNVKKTSFIKNIKLP